MCWYTTSDYGLPSPVEALEKGPLITLFTEEPRHVDCEKMVSIYTNSSHVESPLLIDTYSDI